MYLKHICLTGGDPRELEEIFRQIRGVCETAVGEATDAAGETFAALRLAYDPKKMDLSQLLDLHFALVSPHSPDGQGRARGKKYRAGVLYEEAEDEPHIELYMHFLRSRGKPAAATGANLTLNDPLEKKKAARPCYATAAPLKSFTPAPDAEQRYYARHVEAAPYACIDFAHFWASVRGIRAGE